MTKEHHMRTSWGSIIGIIALVRIKKGMKLDWWVSTKKEPMIKSAT